MTGRPRVVFMGTPEFAVPSLREVARRCEVVAVVTRPDRPRGRGLKLGASEVGMVAAELGLQLLKPDTIKSDGFRAEIEALAPDLFAVVAFGAILAPELLRVPRLGSINLHGSLLPDHRGAAPVQRALWDGRTSTGATTLWMDEGIDTGDRILQCWTPIDAADTSGTLATRIAELGAPLLAESLMLAARGEAPRHPQPREGSYAKKLTKREGQLDFSADAVTVWNRQRAVTPWPGATTGREGRRVMILEARPHDLLPAAAAPGTVLEISAQAVRVACGTGSIELVRVKPDGRGSMLAVDWARGVRVARGDRMEWSEEAVT
jgi:methionyl-tRNA formyltransferase